MLDVVRNSEMISEELTIAGLTHILYSMELRDGYLIVENGCLDVTKSSEMAGRKRSSVTGVLEQNG